MEDGPVQRTEYKDGTGSVPVLQESYNFRNGTVFRILQEYDNQWRRQNFVPGSRGLVRKKTENNKCIPYHPGQHFILPSMRYCLMPVCRSHTIIK